MLKIFIPLFVFCLVFSTYSQCPLNCRNCTSPISCTICNTGFFVVNQTFCNPCPPGCSDCQMGPNGYPACSTCIAPAQLGPNGICFQCDSLCLTCSGIPNNCTSCRDVQQLIPGLMPSTSTCGTIATNCSIPNCAECAPPNAQGIIQCARCSAGFYSFRLACIPCTFPCTSCNFDPSIVWPNVSQFWDMGIRQALNITTPTPPPNSLPPFIPNLDWSNMTNQTQMNWIQAFITYMIVQSASLTNSTPTQLILQGLSFFPSNASLTPIQQQSEILFKVNQFTGLNILPLQWLQMRNQFLSVMTQCNECTLGFQVAMAPDMGCRLCPINCMHCMGGMCHHCREGFFVDNGTCVACTAPCRTCDIVGNNCTACFPPMSYNMGACVLCVDPCLTCDPTNLALCLTCKMPFSLFADGSGSCFRCEQDLCAQCDPTNTSVCIQCRNGSSLTLDGKCNVCPLNCVYCSVANLTIAPICFQCAVGFKLSINGTCLPCGPGCVNCANTCLQCQTGLFLNYTSGNCQKCRDGCLSCTDLDTCLSFDNGVVIFGNITIRCGFGCRMCDPTNPNTCLVCEQRFFLDTNICKSCGIGCKSCQSESSCSQCFDNLVLSGGSCQRCQGNCRTCNSANLTECITCIRGFTLISSSCVKQCSLGCLQCDPSNTTVCLVCDQGHALRPNGQCVRCLNSCSGSCDVRNISICLSCVNGFQLKGGQCVRCPIGCASCLNGQCSLCGVGFKLSQRSTGQLECREQCKFPCSTCSGDTCYSCQNGFTIVANRCQPDLSCNPACDYCPQGTQKTLNGTCIPCPANCSSCLNGACIQCVEGLFLDFNTSQCVPCPPQCRTCFNNDSCDRCSPGFVKQISTMSTGVQDAIYNDRCTPCDPNCKTCIVQADRCTSCFQGYRLFSYRCAGLFTVVYIYQLAINYTNFLDSTQSQQFLQAVSTLLGVNISDNYIQQIRQGSTIVTGVVSASSQQNANTIQSSMASTSALPGFSVLSSSASIYYSDEPYNPKVEEEKKKDENLGVIIGCAVGGAVLIGVVIFIIWKIKSKSNSRVEINKEAETMVEVVDNRVNNNNVSTEYQVNPPTLVTEE